MYACTCVRSGCARERVRARAELPSETPYMLNMMKTRYNDDDNDEDNDVKTICQLHVEYKRAQEVYINDDE